MNPIREKEVEKFLRYIPLVGEQLAIQAFSQHLKQFLVLVADVSACEEEGDNLPSVIASQMELETWLQKLLDKIPISVKAYLNKKHAKLLAIFYKYHINNF